MKKLKIWVFGKFGFLNELSLSALCFFGQKTILHSLIFLSAGQITRLFGKGHYPVAIHFWLKLKAWNLTLFRIFWWLINLKRLCYLQKLCNHSEELIFTKHITFFIKKLFSAPATLLKSILKYVSGQKLRLSFNFSTFKQ